MGSDPFSPGKSPEQMGSDPFSPGVSPEQVGSAPEPSTTSSKDEEPGDTTKISRRPRRKNENPMSPSLLLAHAGSKGFAPCAFFVSSPFFVVEKGLAHSLGSARPRGSGGRAVEVTEVRIQHPANPPREDRYPESRGKAVRHPLTLPSFLVNPRCSSLEPVLDRL